jgi:hypothetical protein
MFAHLLSGPASPPSDDLTLALVRLLRKLGYAYPERARIVDWVGQFHSAQCAPVREEWHRDEIEKILPFDEARFSEPEFNDYAWELD